MVDACPVLIRRMTKEERQSRVVATTAMQLAGELIFVIRSQRAIPKDQLT